MTRALTSPSRLAGNAFSSRASGVSSARLIRGHSLAKATSFLIALLICSIRSYIPNLPSISRAFAGWLIWNHAISDESGIQLR
jgi:hypothetical protein